MEEFREIPNCPGYFVSNRGTVRRGLSKILKQYRDADGYLILSILMNGKRKSSSVHRLVAMTFIGDVKGMTVDHKNHIKSDNWVENLEIVTQKENRERYLMFRKNNPSEWRMAADSCMWDMKKIKEKEIERTIERTGKL